MKKINFILLILLTTVPLLAHSSNSLRDFSTDGCSMWIDGYRIFSDTNWTHCCIQHDTRYFGGGTRDEKEIADVELKECIEDTGATKMAFVMYQGVKVGGTAHVRTHFRWGYGWMTGRGYEPLTAELQARVDKITDKIDIYDLDQIINPFALQDDDDLIHVIAP